MISMGQVGVGHEDIQQQIVHQGNLRGYHSLTHTEPEYDALYRVDNAYLRNGSQSTLDYWTSRYRFIGLKCWNLTAWILGLREDYRLSSTLNLVWSIKILDDSHSVVWRTCSHGIGLVHAFVFKTFESSTTKLCSTSLEDYVDYFDFGWLIRSVLNFEVDVQR